MYKGEGEEGMSAIWLKVLLQVISGTELVKVCLCCINMDKILHFL